MGMNFYFICFELWFPGTFTILCMYICVFMYVYVCVCVGGGGVHTHTHTTHTYIYIYIYRNKYRSIVLLIVNLCITPIKLIQWLGIPLFFHILLLFTHIRNLQAEQMLFFSPVCFVVWLEIPGFSKCCLLFQVKYKAIPLQMAAVICNCLREERRILSTASMQEQVLPRHVTNSMQKPQIPRAMLLTKLQSFALAWYYSVPVWDPNGRFSLS